MHTKIEIKQSSPCDCFTTSYGPWKCQLWFGNKLSISDGSICNFVELIPNTKCSTLSREWQTAATIFSESCRNDSHSTASDLLMIGAIWVGNGQSAINMENYREKLKQQGITDTSSKYLFHTAQSWEDTINICKTGFRIPTEYKPGRQIIGMGVYAGQPKYVAQLSSDIGRHQRVNNQLLNLNNPLTMLLCQGIPGKSYLAYTCIDGSPLIPGYNSHKSVGIPPHEMCFFDTNAIRPMYIIKVIRYTTGIKQVLNSTLSHSTLFSFFKRDYESFLEKHRHDNPESQYEYDKRFGLVPK